MEVAFVKTVAEVENYILRNNSKEFKLIDCRYKFVDMDHDVWDFEAIVQRISDSKFFSFIWSDNYSCTMKEMYGEDYEIEFKEVVPTKVSKIVYE